MTGQLTYESFWEGLGSHDESVIRRGGSFLRPENRSSAIFPIFKSSSIKTSILFLSYWLKKHGDKVVVCYTVRNADGKQLNKSYAVITACMAYKVEASNFFSKEENNFCGSIEVEVFSKNRPLYNFPAMTACYEGDDSSSVVHSCIRMYNSNEVVRDYAITQPQTGFDLDFGYQSRNFICFFGGRICIYNLTLELIEGGFSRKYKLEFSSTAYGQMHLIWLENLISPIDSRLFKAPKCLIHHDFQDIFPRFYVGILKEACAPTMTHTFFDTSKVESIDNVNALNLRAKNPDPSNYFDSAFIVPLFSLDSFDTVLRSYGQNLDFSGDVLLSLRALNGDIIYSRNLSRNGEFSCCESFTLELSEICNQGHVDTDKPYCLKIAFASKDIPFPRRFKLGLNIKRKGQRLGTNICFAPLVISEDTLHKPFNRRWFPVGGPRNFVATIHNTSLEILEPIGITECNFEFFNRYGESLSRRIYVRKNGSVIVDAEQDQDLNLFLGQQEGWCMVTSMSYLADAYYFSLADNQIGGDHAY